MYCPHLQDSPYHPTLWITRGEGCTIPSWRHGSPPLGVAWNCSSPPSWADRPWRGAGCSRSACSTSPPPALLSAAAQTHPGTSSPRIGTSGGATGAWTRAPTRSGTARLRRKCRRRMPCYFGQTMCQLINWAVAARKLYPNKRILATKLNVKAAYQQCHLNAFIATQTCTQIPLEGLALMMLRLTCGGVPCPSEWGYIAESICNLVKSLEVLPWLCVKGNFLDHVMLQSRCDVG
jgi:hypothetical protein